MNICYKYIHTLIFELWMIKDNVRNATLWIEKHYKPTSNIYTLI